MKKTARLLACVIFCTSVNVYGNPAEDATDHTIALSAEPLIGRTVEVMTNQEPETIQWKCADSENGFYHSLNGETGKRLYISQDLLGKWLVAEVDGVESEPYQEVSGKLLGCEGFSGYTDHTKIEDGNPYYDSPGDGVNLTFSFAAQMQGDVAVDFRYKYAGDHNDSMILQLFGNDQKSGTELYFYNQVIKTWQSQGELSGTNSDFRPASGDNHDGAWHTLKLVLHLTNKEMDLYIDGEKQVSPGFDRWNTSYFQNEFAGIRFNFLRSFSVDDVRIYRVMDTSGKNEVPYVEGAIRLQRTQAHLDFTIRDYDRDAIAWQKLEWFYSDRRDGEYTKIENETTDIPYKSEYKYIKCVMTACDDLGAVSTVTAGPLCWVSGKEMPYIPMPAISGECRIGTTLTGKLLGSWTNPAGEYGVRSASEAWYRAENVTGVWEKVGDDSSYTVTAADEGKYITYGSEFTFGDGTLEPRKRMAQPIYCPKMNPLRTVTDGNGNRKLVTEITNKAGAEIPFQAVTAYYCQGRLERAAITSHSVLQGAGYTKIAVPVEAGEDPVKCFLIKDLDSMTPLGDAVEIGRGNEFLKRKAYTFDGQRDASIVDGCVKIEKDGYIVFRNIELTDAVKYVTVKASRRSGEEERYLFRLNSPSGTIIADCKVEETGGLDRFLEFTYPVTAAPGVYDLYIVGEFGNPARLDQFTFSDENHHVPEFAIPESNVIDNYHDTWTAVDGAGRAVADYEETGAVRNGKYVAMFYWPWHEDWSDRTAPVNVSGIMEEHPEIIHDYKSELWPTAPAYFWEEPLFGYYRTSDRWVLRKHAQMLANAGVDVIVLDCTNGNASWETGYSAIFRAFAEARADGIRAPQIAFMSNFAPGENTAVFLEKIYKNLYRDEKYKDLWFYWKGKPLVMAYSDSLDSPGDDPERQKLYGEIKNFFTFREPQSTYDHGPFNNQQWGWLEKYPQHKYVENADGSCEEVTAGIAQNFSYITKSLTAMNQDYVQGRSYTERYGEDLSKNASDYGYNFKEQFEYAISLDPELIFVTGWNEWIAGRYDEWYGTENGFPDQFNYERSRDIEPMSGRYGDNYYYQLVNYIRKFKGTRSTPKASAKKTIDLDGDLRQWSGVTPSFINDKGTTLHRDADGYRGTHYTNTTGRNDIVLAKVARDDQYITFYVQTDKTLTDKNDPNWMTLYLNTDRNYATGWQGYDYAVNRISPGEKAYLEHNSTGVWEWESVLEVDYRIQENVLQIRIPKTALGLTGDEIDLELKWTDNIDVRGDADKFWLDGCSAPCGRFNYRYTTKGVTIFTAAVRNDLKDKVILQAGASYLYVNGAKMPVYDADKRAAPFVSGNSLYFPAKAIEKIIYGSKVEIKDRYITVKSDDQTLRLYRDQTCRLNGRLQQKSYPIMVKDQIDYVNAEILSDIFGKTLRKEEHQIYTFSENAVSDAALEAINQLCEEME